MWRRLGRVPKVIGRLIIAVVVGVEVVTVDRDNNVEDMKVLKATRLLVAVAMFLPLPQPAQEMKEVKSEEAAVVVAVVLVGVVVALVVPSNRSRR